MHQAGREGMFPAELGGRLLTPVDLVHNVELERAAVGASGHRDSFGAISLRANGGEVPCLLVRSWGVIPVCPNWSMMPKGLLEAPRFFTETEAVQALGVPDEVLRVTWAYPRLRVRRTKGGRYAPPEHHWKAAAWLGAVAGALAEAGHTTWDERLLFAAVRSLPGMPDVQDSTLRGALHKGAAFEKTHLPECGTSGVRRNLGHRHEP